MREAAPKSEALPVGTVLAERYRIEKRLGHGGMGAVYLAEHVRMHKPFAIKVLHKEMSSVAEAVFRFEREAVASSRVDHPHLVTTTDFGALPDGSLYLVMEYVPGVSLGALIEQGPIETMRALKIARQIAEVLGAVHSAGVLHRDLKPDNVMLVDKQGEDYVKLLDFGMAKVQTGQSNLPQVTRAGFVFGTPRYMAPEQAAGAPTDHRADLYSLGVMLYAMLAGEPPFAGDDIKDVLSKQQHELPPPLPSSVDSGVAALVMKLLEKAPQARVQTAEGLIRYIDRLLARLSGSRRAWLDSALVALRRPKVLAAVAGALGVTVFLLVAAIGGSRDDAAVSSASAAAPEPGPSADLALQRLLVRAEVGEEEAWRLLEARKAEERSAKEWLVLGKARTDRGKRLDGLEAYQRALEADAASARDWRLLHDVAAATEDPKVWEKAMRVAAAIPGPDGADILYQVWASTLKATTKTRLAKQLLETALVRKHASEAVRLALDFRNVRGQGCEAYKKLLPRAKAHADSRSLLPLLKLSNRDGCGPRERSDCYPCLRGDPALEAAVARAKANLAPDYSRSHAPAAE